MSGAIAMRRPEDVDVVADRYLAAVKFVTIINRTSDKALYAFDANIIAPRTSVM